MTEMHPDYPSLTKAHVRAITIRSYAPVVSLVVLLLIGIGFFIKYSMDREAAIEACVERGVNFYKGSDSYPRFTSYPNRGRPTEEVVREKCQRGPEIYSDL